ncbi:hypothetical protein IWX46DRAFT_270378 [Phyllosticta citricarpa]|uniref:Uncharacterized protein n=1 Tax=Phyllosticta citricarpa TaxID=55181 RepID=A0ABR1LNT0_9PEZI
MRASSSVSKLMRKPSFSFATSSRWSGQSATNLQERPRQTRIYEDYASMKEQLDELETMREQSSALRKANEENMVTIANGEQEIFDQKTAKKRLEHELKLCTGRLEQAKEMANRYQEANQELENKLRELEDRATGAEALGSLEEQLAKEDDDGRSMRRSFFGVESADVILLQQKISLLESRCKRIEEKYLDVYQENLGLQAALQDEQELKEADEPFVHQTNRLHAAEAELKELTNKVHAISTKNMELQHQLAEITGTGKTDGAGADYDTLKENYEQMLQSHEELQKHAEKVDTELDDQKALLRHKLLNPEVLRQEDVELFESNEHKLLLEQLNLFKEALEEESDQMKHSIAAEVTKKLHNGIVDLASRDKRIAEQETQIKLLRQNIEKIKRETGDKASPEVQKELEALRRENKLMTSAWYDMASRLQSNTVVLQRTKAETPKSWLGRQRMEVTHGGGRGLGANIRR